jgi:hypothetical protein
MIRILPRLAKQALYEFKIYLLFFICLDTPIPVENVPTPLNKSFYIRFFPGKNRFNQEKTVQFSSVVLPCHVPVHGQITIRGIVRPGYPGGRFRGLQKNYDLNACFAKITLYIGNLKGGCSTGANPAPLSGPVGDFFIRAGFTTIA